MSDRTSGQPTPDPNQQPGGHGVSSPQGGQWATPGSEGVPQKRKRRKWPWVVLGVAILGIVGGCVAVVAGISDEADKKVTVKYEVTGDATNVSITYSTWDDGNNSTGQETSNFLPWVKEIKAKGFGKGGSLVVMTGEAGGTATFSVTVDNGTPRTATATGAFASATCSGF